jgi:exosortase
MAPVTAVSEPLVSGATARPATGRRNRLAVAAVAVGLALVYAPTIAWLVGRWTISVWHHAHGLFIPPLVIWLVAQELKRHKDLPVEASKWGFLLLVPALMLHVLDTGIQTQLLSAASIVIALPGLSLLFLGWPRTKTILFPLLFTAFALPIPLALTQQVHLALRQITTAFVTPILSATGVSLFTEGTTVYLANATVEIADACSGFSTLYASMAFAFLLAYFSPSTKRRVMVLAVAAPVAIGANVLRMVLLLHLVVWQGPWVLDTFIHPLSGMLTFAIALPLLLWIGGDRPSPAPPRPVATATGSASA